MRTNGNAIALTAALALLAAAAAAAAQAAEPRYEPRAAFAESDTSRDEVVDHGEFVTRMTDVFYEADADKNGVLTPEEAKRTLTVTENVRGADSNGDGKLTLHEFMRARLRDYDQADKNANGVLELDEVIDVYEKPAAR